MSKEIISINQIEEQRGYLSQCLTERGALVDRIGTGAVKVGSSFENTLKVGRTRGAVRDSMTRIQGKIDDLNQELDAYGQTCDHLNQINLRRTQLGEISQMVTDGNLTPDIYQLHQQQLQELVSSLETNPILIRGMRRIELEEEAKKREQSDISKPVEPIALIPPQNEISPVTISTPETNEPSEETEEPNSYRLPNGQEVIGRSAQLLHLLDGTSPDNSLASDQITQAMWPDVDNKKARNNLGMVIAKFRKDFPDNGLEIVIISDPAKRREGQKASYYSIISDQSTDFHFDNEEPVTTVETDNLLPKSDLSKTNGINDEIVYREIPKVRSIDEEIASINKPEYGTLSRADISAIASAIICYEESLESILETNNVRLIDQSTLIELQNLTGDTPLANFDKMKKEERCQFSDQFRIQALQKAKDLLESPKVDQILDGISAQDNNVWCLLVNLSEMDKVRVTVWNEGIVKQGITFLTDLLANPEARKQGFSVKKKPIITPESPVTQTNTAETIFEPQIPSGETPEVEAKVDIAPVLTTPIAPEIPQPKTKLKAIEIHDPSIRVKINDFLDQISEHPELLSAASPAMITRVFPRLKQKTIDQAIEINCIPAEKDHDGKNRFGPIGTASLLYLYEFGKNLPSRLKKQIEDIVAEEYDKRQNK